MQTRILIALAFLLAMVNGTGAYKFSALLMNLLYMSGLLIFVWDRLLQLQKNGADSIAFDLKKSGILILYICFLLAYFLREAQIDSDYLFNAHEGIMRQYSDLFRGLVGYLIVSATYDAVKNDKIFVFLPVICLAILLLGLILESLEIINFNADVHEKDQFEITNENKLLARPGGFMNANMTAALALVWLYVSLEATLKSPATLKSIALVLAVLICLLTQSRAAILFAVMYAVHATVILRNTNFLIAMAFGVVGLVGASFYFDFDIVNELLEKFTSRTASNESNTQERLGLIAYAFDSFLDSPVLGNGIFYVAKTEGQGNSAHNQILEILTNFGLVGFIMMGLLYWAFYHKNSVSYLALCIFPTLFFSHNFFENSAFQVALAFAYCSNHHQTINNEN
jgi:O-antigen ligase